MNQIRKYRLKIRILRAYATFRACPQEWLLLPVCMAILANCLPSNDLARSRAGGARNASNSLSGGSSTSSGSDGAQGQCALIDATSPERQICQDCYTTILQSRCPGKTDPGSCQDPDVASNFTNLVNLCIAQTVEAGFTCSVSCGDGQVLNPSTCSCVAASTTVGAVGAGGSEFIDAGATDFGPPVVTAFWPFGNFAASYDDTTGVCTSVVSPIYYFVRNRGDTVAHMNTSTVVDFSCKDGDTAPNGQDIIQSVDPLTTDATGYTVGRFEVLAVGSPTGVTNFTNAVYYWNFSDPPIGTGTWSSSSGLLFSSDDGADDGTDTNDIDFGMPGAPHNDDFNGPLPNDGTPVTDPGGTPPTAPTGTSVTPGIFLGRYAGSESVSLSIPTQPAGQYKLTFLLYVIDSWEGNNGGPDRFKVTVNDTNDIFNYTFENSPTAGITQSYPGNPSHPLAPPKNLGFLGGANDNDAVYPITVSFLHTGGPIKLTFQAQGIGAIADESWGIDSVGLTYAPEVRCGIKYSFTDSNRLTSNYCLRFKVRIGCESGTAYSCKCWADPDPTGKGTFFTVEQNGADDCF